MPDRSGNKWFVLGIVACGIFMANLDSSVVNLAITNMMQTFNSTVDDIQWVLSAYTLVMGVVVPVSGYLSDRFGIKTIFISALSMFTLGSLLCGVAWNTMTIIIFRIIQGLGGGLILPIGMIIMLINFDVKERAAAAGIVGLASMAAPALGPTIGGYIIQNLDWRLVFFINIPIGIICITLAVIVFKESEKKEHLYFDALGFITCSIGLSCILYILGLDNVDFTNDLKELLILIIGCCNMLVFIINELTIEKPMLDLRLLKNHVFALGNVIMNVSLLALYGGIFLMPIFLQKLKGLTAMQSGLILFPEGIATAVSMVISSKLSDKIPGRYFAAISLILIGFNSYSMSKLTLDTANSTITILLMIRGIGVGMLLAPVQLVTLNSVPKEMNSNASAILNTIKQIGVSLGITIVTRILQNRSAIDYANIAQQINSFTPNSVGLVKTLNGLLVQSGISQSQSQDIAVAKIYEIVVKQASIQGLTDTMFVIFVICFVMIIPSFLLKEKRFN